MIRENLTSNTELSTLTQCEMRWWLRYGENIKGDPSDAMLLGRLMHDLIGRMRRGEDWRFHLRWLVACEGGGKSDAVVLEYLEGVFGLAFWLACRYERQYGDEFDRIEVVASELDLKASLPGTDFEYQAIIDEVWKDAHGLLWVVERKTFGRNDRLNWIDVDPQLTGNLWVARANGIDAVGIVFDGLYTYRWKPEKPTLTQVERVILDEQGLEEAPAGGKKLLRDEAKRRQEFMPGLDRPDSESFTRLYLDRTEAHIEAAQHELAAQIQRRLDLSWGARPYRNIGPACGKCDQRIVCHERLAFPPMTITIEDE